ncbi:MAG TPA: FtsX-like permease family protein [Gemmatimonadales bacterium]|nr:FtsX-like permease family protein [Gemmatimonadales bacterium]
MIRPSDWRGAVRRTWVPALDGFRMYGGTAALAVGLGVIALVAVLVPASLIGAGGALGQPRLELVPIAGGDLGLPWAIAAQDPSTTQRAALQQFVRMLGVAGLGALALAVVGMLCVFGARAAARTPELMLRRAIGATRRGLTLSALAEGVVIVALVLALGAGAAWATAEAAIASWPGQVGAAAISPYLWVAAFIAAVMLLGVWLPVALARRPATGAEGQRPTPLAPVAILLGASLTIVAGGALLLRHADRQLQAGPVAASTDGRLVPIAAAGSPAERAAQYESLLERVRGLADSNTVSLHNPGTPIGMGVVGLVTTECGMCVEALMMVKWRFTTATHHTVSADSFGTLGLRLVAGRGITADDRWDAPRVAVVSESLARDYFQDGQAVGRRMRVADQSERDGWSTVVGVVEDTAPTAFGATLQPRRAVYVSVLQHPPTNAELLVRRSERHGSDAQVERALAAASPTISRGESSTEAALRAAQIAPLRWFGRWFVLEGAAMVAIASIGTFALMRLRVLSLLSEIGLRRSVGARRRQILSLVIRQALGAGVAGIVLGVWFGIPMWSAVASLVPGLPSWDTPLVTYAALLLAAIALAGALGPAWRAARMPPATLLDAPGDFPARRTARRSARA